MPGDRRNRNPTPPVPVIWTYLPTAISPDCILCVAPKSMIGLMEVEVRVGTLNLVMTGALKLPAGTKLPFMNRDKPANRQVNSIATTIPIRIGLSSSLFIIHIKYYYTRNKMCNLYEYS
jgi:hypothetical protein